MIIYSPLFFYRFAVCAPLLHTVTILCGSEPIHGAVSSAVRSVTRQTLSGYWYCAGHLRPTMETCPCYLAGGVHTMVRCPALFIPDHLEYFHMPRGFTCMITVIQLRGKHPILVILPWRMYSI